MERKLNQYLRTYPIFAGITGDLLFYIAVDTLFLTVVKNLSAAQIVSLASVSSFACIILQAPILKLIQKLGNTRSTQLGAVILLIGALSITFGTNYYWIAFGRVCRQFSVLFRSTLSVSLKNNLDLLHREQDYVKFRTAGNMAYSIITMLIAFVASKMFVWNHMAPMYGCIICAGIGVLLSFLMTDYSDFDKTTPQKVEKKKTRFNPLILLSLFSFALFLPRVETGQSNGILFLQQKLLEDLDVDRTALLIGVVIASSRIVRVFSNLIFVPLYRRLQYKVGTLLSLLLILSFVLFVIGSFLSSYYLKTIIMGLGYLVILFIRDPFRIYTQDVILNHTEKEAHQSLLATLEFSLMFGSAAMGLCFSLILMKFPMLAVMGTMCILAVVECILCIRLYQTLNSKEVKTIA